MVLEFRKLGMPVIFLAMFKVVKTTILSFVNFYMNHCSLEDNVRMLITKIIVCALII